MKTPLSIGGLAIWYSCSETTIKRYRAIGAPLHDPALMAEWIKIREGVPAGMRQAIKRHMAPTNPKPDEGSAADAWKKFKADRAGKPKDHAQQLTDLEEFRDFYAQQLERAIEADEQDTIKFYTGLLLDVTNSIRQTKLAADKLGIEEGQLFTKAELERIIRAWTFWSMYALDVDLAELCKNLLGKKSVDEARDVLEPWLLSKRFVKPFAKASRIESQSALMPWMVEVMKDSCDDFIENGVKEFEEAAKL